MTHRRQNFMGGAAILALAVAVTKLLGALYKIPLGNLLDREGMAHFTPPIIFTACCWCCLRQDCPWR